MAIVQRILVLSAGPKKRCFMVALDLPVALRAAKNDSPIPDPPSFPQWDRTGDCAQLRIGLGKELN